MWRSCLRLASATFAWSSFINHVYRCCRQDLKVQNQLETAPAGAAENTQDIKMVPVLAGLCLIDTPAIPNMSEHMEEAFGALLAGKIPEGVRRKDFNKSKCCYSKPPHAAILVVSLLHWRDQQEEMALYLGAMSRKLKTASDGRVAFPFVIAATHRDEFLRCCEFNKKPHEELEAVLNSMRKAANTNEVFAVTNYKKGGLASMEVNEQTFALLSQVIPLAARGNTGAVVQQNQNRMMAVGAMLVLAVALCVGYVLCYAPVGGKGS